MDIPKKIAELEAEYDEIEKRHAADKLKMKLLRTQIGKLQTIAKHAQELFAGKETETV
jgi:hypothetical protein